MGKKLDYSSMYSLNIAATQELYKIILNLENRIKILEFNLINLSIILI